MLLRATLTALLTALAPAGCAGQAATPAGGSAPRPDSALDRAIASFAARLAADVARDSVGSLSAAVVVGDSVVWTGAFGVADRETGAPATAATVYRVGSITKTVTAAALLRLAGAGVLALDEPVAFRVPELAGLAGLRREDRPITYGDLASHTAGLEREPSASYAGRGRRSDWKQKTVAAIPLTEAARAPGEAYGYSNIGYAILGLALERAAGHAFERLVAEEVLGPLGMESASFRPPPSRSRRLAAGYVNLEDGTIDPRVPRAEHRGRGYKLPSEGLYATVGDLARLVMGLSGALGDQPLDDDARAAMLRDRAPDGDDRAGYGLGLQLTRIGDVLLAGHSGTVAGYTSYLVFDPSTRAGVVLLRSYNRGETNLAAEAQRLVLEIGAVVSR